MRVMLTRAAVVIFAVNLCAAGVAYSQGGRSWPADQSRMQPGESTSTVKARIPSPRPIKAPGPEVPERIRGLSGRWIGWAGGGRNSSVAVDVEELTARGGTVAYYLASASFTTAHEYRTSVMVLNGTDLEGNIGGGTWIKMRLRPDGAADFMVYWAANGRWGVLTKQ